jgi:nitric oxide reductase NorE protein
MTTEPSRSTDATWEPPGGVLVWILVFLEVLTFGGGIGVFLFQARDHAAEFQHGHAMLNQPLAFINTLVLLTGGWCMANGVASLRAGLRDPALRWVRLAMVSGLAFTVIKGVEYAEKVQHGIGFADDAFFTLYFLLTGFHLMHVLVAVVLLFFMARGIRLGTYHRDDHENVEASGVFWHMCDLVWLLLYPVIYLL